MYIYIGYWFVSKYVPGLIQGYDVVQKRGPAHGTNHGALLVAVEMSPLEATVTAGWEESLAAAPTFGTHVLMIAAVI